MAVYLGNQHIKDLYFGETKIAEAYFGSVKVYPESASGELIFKIIFTDSEGNTYDQLAFKNINTNEIITPKLCINGLDGGNYTGNSLVDDTVTEYLDSINSALERGDHTGNPTLLYIAAIREENNTLSNSLNSIRGISLDLRKVINSGTDTEVDIDSIEQGIDYQPAGISPGYELVGRKNGTGDIITICGDVDEKKITVNKATIQNNIVRLYLNFNGTTTPIESEFSIIMEPSLSFTDTFTTPNGLTLNKNGNYEASMSQLEYDNYLNEDGFYPLTFGTEVLQDWYFYDGLSVAIFQEHTEDSSVAIPNGKVTIYDTSDYNFITGDYISSSPYIYELYLNNNVTNKEEVSLYAGHSIGRVGIVDSKGKEYKFEFRIPSTPPPVTPENPTKLTLSNLQLSYFGGLRDEEKNYMDLILKDTNSDWERTLPYNTEYTSGGRYPLDESVPTNTTFIISTSLGDELCRFSLNETTTLYGGTTYECSLISANPIPDGYYTYSISTGLVDVRGDIIYEVEASVKGTLDFVIILKFE